MNAPRPAYPPPFAVDIERHDLYDAQLYPRRLGPSAGAFARYGHDRPSSPEGQRPLTPAEWAVSTVWTWDEALGTYTSPEHPTGLP